MSAMEWKTLSVDALRPAAYNPRKKLKAGDKEYEKIKNSILEFGYVEPIIVNYDMTVIGGHQRLTVLKDLGYTEVQCVVVHIEDEHKVKALNIALNKITGAWNEQLLADLLVDLQSVDFNTDLTGFEAPEIEQLFSKVHNKDIKEDDFDVEQELKNPPVSQKGDIWLLGRHRVICGDSTLPETYTKLMEGRRANLVLTDPPYNVNVEETAGKIQNDNMPDEDFYKFLFAAFVNMEQNMENDASIYVFHDHRLIDTLSEENIMRRLATTITTSGEHKINIAATKPAASWIEEGGALTFGDATFSQILLDAHKLHVAIKVTEELLYDNAFNLEGYILGQFGKALGNAEEDAFLNGDGTGKPLGLFAATGGGTVAGTLTAAIKSDDMLDLVYALKRPYRKKASFIMNDKTLSSLRKLKDNNGAYIWQPSYQAGEPDRVLGYAVHTSAYAPEDAIAFGDYKYYNIGDRGTRSFSELRELFAGNGMIGYVAKERVDGKLILPEAVQILKLKASTPSGGGTE